MRISDWSSDVCSSDLNQALLTVRNVVAGGGRVLFVGTKRQASDKVAEAAKRCGQYYVNHRWLGGMLTNWKTISNSIKRLRAVEEQLSEGGQVGLTKKIGRASCWERVCQYV